MEELEARIDRLEARLDAAIDPEAIYKIVESMKMDAIREAPAAAISDGVAKAIENVRSKCGKREVS